MVKKKIYLSGRMTGIEDFGFSKFEYWENYWKGRGYKVHNPAKAFFGITWLPWLVYIITDILILRFCSISHIFLMKDFEYSPGACIEAMVAVKFDIKIVPEDCNLEIYHDKEDCQ